MIQKTFNNIPLLLFHKLDAFPSLLHAVTTRSGGISPPPFAGLNLGIESGDSPHNVTENHRALCAALAVSPSQLVSSRQVHGTAVARIDKPPQHDLSLPGAYTLDGYDALVTDVAGPVLMVRVADCVPLVLYDPVNRAVGVVHAGWRGTLNEIAITAVRTMMMHYNSSPADIIACIGPSIGPCCYRVDRRMFDTFRKRLYASAHNSESRTIDLRAANRVQLLHSGCNANNIEDANTCTACSLNVFFSHRREKGKTGRFAVVAGLRL